MIDERFPPPDLCPAEPLSQVVFIHDYLQLVFQSQCLSVYNLAQIEHMGATLTQGSSGFCDALVSLIGSAVLRAHHNERYKLILEFQNGSNFFVPVAAEYVRGPEAFQFVGTDEYLVVEQNG